MQRSPSRPPSPVGEWRRIGTAFLYLYILEHTMPRTDEWLQNEFNLIVKNHFPEIKQVDSVTITFGRPTAVRLGSIRLMKRSERTAGTLIRVNGLFRNPRIPLFVVREVIAHELAHLVHGVHTVSERRYRHPHRGGVVTTELVDRGIGEVVYLSKTWLKQNWQSFISEVRAQGILKPPRRRSIRQRRGLRRYGRMYFLPY